MSRRRVLGIVPTFVFGTIGVFCIVYYLSKFYTKGFVEFNHNAIIGFSIVATMIIISLISSMIIYVKLCKMENKNVELSNQISHLSKEIEKFHYSEMESINSNMECILDLDERR